MMSKRHLRDTALCAHKLLPLVLFTANWKKVNIKERQPEAACLEGDLKGCSSLFYDK